MTNDQEVRKQLIAMLNIQQAHMLIDDALQEFPLEQINVKPPGLEYSFWHLVEHLRLTQVDILEYITDSNYQYRKFPDDYWPDFDTNTDVAGWDRSIAAFKSDMQALIDIANGPATDLYAQIPHAETGHTILREINIIATHNAYHIGELGILRQVMGLW